MKVLPRLDGGLMLFCNTWISALSFAPNRLTISAIVALLPADMTNVAVANSSILSSKSCILCEARITSTPHLRP